MNVKLLLALALVVGMALTMKDTITTGFSLMTGHIEAIDNGGTMPQTSPVEQIHPDSDTRTVWEIESDRRIRLWRDCTYTTYREENKDECDRLYESVNR